MNNAKKVFIVAIALLMFCQGTLAYDATFVKNNDGEQPKFSIFSLFGKKEEPKEDKEQKPGKKENASEGKGTVETSVTTNADEFAALDGVLTVKINTPEEGSLNCTVPDESNVMFEIVTPPEKGAVEITDNATGDFIYTPHQDEVGEDSFTFSATIGTGEDDTKTATISVTIEYDEEEPPTEPEEPVYSFRYEDMFGHWGEYSAIRIGERDIFRGFKIGQKFYFYPEEELTRGDFLLYLVASLGIDVSEYAEVESPFADADTTPSWMNLQAKAAFDAGIIKGSLEDGKLYLHASERLTRLEAIAMLNNTIKPDAVAVGNTDYTDMYLVPDWGVQFIQNMSAYGLIQGYDDGSIRPFAKITRAMSAEMMLQTIKYKETHPEVVTQLTKEMDKSMVY
ncbi:MAG: S-layer homology domain-containing protein [Firmicutes bacterium]|nr:S-layer homology domain-containing protein [Bacillota bacterium]